MKKVFILAAASALVLACGQPVQPEGPSRPVVDTSFTALDMVAITSTAGAPASAQEALDALGTSSSSVSSTLSGLALTSPASFSLNRNLGIRWPQGFSDDLNPNTFNGHIYVDLNKNRPATEANPVAASLYLKGSLGLSNDFGWKVYNMTYDTYDQNGNPIKGTVPMNYPAQPLDADGNPTSVSSEVTTFSPLTNRNFGFTLNLDAVASVTGAPSVPKAVLDGKINLAVKLKNFDLQWPTPANGQTMSLKGSLDFSLKLAAKAAFVLDTETSAGRVLVETSYDNAFTSLPLDTTASSSDAAASLTKVVDDLKNLKAYVTIYDKDNNLVKDKEPVALFPAAPEPVPVTP